MKHAKTSARRGAIQAFGLFLVLLSVLLGLLMRSEPENVSNSDTINAQITSEEKEQSIVSNSDTGPEAPLPDEYDAEDVRLLAKIMDAEDGHDWPDAIILCIGEVVLNRVSSPEFPDTIRDVLYQDDSGIIQYAPVHSAAWAASEPTERYIELAKRLLDGERILNDPAIIYQATFEQGRGTVLSYHDFYIGSTTYFCRSERPGLYVEASP